MSQPATPQKKTIWLVARAGQEEVAARMARALEPQARCLVMGADGFSGPDLDLGPEPSLAGAWECCPPEMEPEACVLLFGDGRQTGADALPCPLAGWDEGRGDEKLPPDPTGAAERVLELTQQGPDFAWLPRVQVNLPLRGILGKYRENFQAHPLNPEISLDAAALDALGQEDLDQARELLKGRLVSGHLPFIDLIPASVDPRVAAVAQERLMRAAAWLLELGAKQCVAHTGFIPQLHWDQESFARRFARTMTPLALRLAAAGTPLALENTFEPGPGVLLSCRRALAEASGVEAVLCLDVGHVHAFSTTPLKVWWEAMSPHLRELHLHDNHGGKDQHLPVGWGRAEWDYLKGELAGLEREPLFTLEPHQEPHLWASLRGLMRIWGAPALTRDLA